MGATPSEIPVGDPQESQDLPKRIAILIECDPYTGATQVVYTGQPAFMPVRFLGEDGVVEWHAGKFLDQGSPCDGDGDVLPLVSDGDDDEVTG